VVKEPLTIIFALGMMFAISTKLTLFVLILISTVDFILFQNGRICTRHKKESGTISVVEETLGGLKVIKVHC
jgi:subfamily B ATP-binding cassette protein MsbA